MTDGRTVVVRMRCRGTHRGEWQGLAPTGRPMKIDEVYFFRITDDRISGVWGLEDTWTRMQQLAGGRRPAGPARLTQRAPCIRLGPGKRSALTKRSRIRR